MEKAEEKHEILIQKMKDYKSIEKIKDKKKLEFKEQVKTTELKQEDDMMVLRGRTRGVG